jgi:hypothetical protein
MVQKPQYSIYLNVIQRQMPTLAYGNEDVSAVHIPKTHYYSQNVFITTKQHNKEQGLVRTA